jgi:hypothetical protein
LSEAVEEDEWWPRSAHVDMKGHAG